MQISVLSISDIGKTCSLLLCLKDKILLMAVVCTGILRRWCSSKKKDTLCGALNRRLWDFLQACYIILKYICNYVVIACKLNLRLVFVYLHHFRTNDFILFSPRIETYSSELILFAVQVFLSKRFSVHYVSKTVPITQFIFLIGHRIGCCFTW